MAIQNLLRLAGALQEHYTAGEYIFREDAIPQFFYMLTEGEVKLNNYSEEGKELIQNMLNPGACFGESMLILGKPYPVNAVALTGCTVLKLGKEKFLDMLKTEGGIAFELCTALSEKTYNKFVLMRKIASKNAINRIIEIMDLIKEEQGVTKPFELQIPLTRQQLASLTGLCLETTIRAVKKMEKDQLLKIKNRKIYY
jgi:CRP-like cAMP-binding protein